MAVHVMWDLETFGLKHDAIPLAFGAVKFDKDKIVDKFRVGIDPVDAERYGLTIDASTFMWWMGPKCADARTAMLALPKVQLGDAMHGLVEWINETPAEDLGSAWGKGATFDNVKIKHYCDLLGLPYPFHYRQDECYRTIANRFPDIAYVQIGTAHDPLDDAISQVVHLQIIARLHGVVL